MCVSTPGHTWLPLLWYPHQGGLTWDHTPQHSQILELKETEEGEDGCFGGKGSVEGN